MTTVSMVGFTHRACALGVLERVSVPPAEREALLARVRAAGYDEAVVLSTCSRTEIYVAGDEPARLLGLLGLLVERGGGWTQELRAAAEARAGGDAVTHLFRVAAGLDSRVVGEPEIRGQVRAAYRQACAAGAVGGTLGELFPRALRAAAEVRFRTSVVSQARSLAHRAVATGLAGCTTPEPRVVVLGSGRMASAAVEELHGRGHRPVVVARSVEHAGRLVGAAAARPLDALAEELAEADLLISATAADQALVTVDVVGPALASRTRPLTVVDLSVPRNVAPAVGDLAPVLLVDVEDLAAAAADDPELAAALVHAEALLREAARRYEEHVAARRAGPLIAAMRRRVEQVCLETLEHGRPDTPADELAALAQSAAGRLSHEATMLARAAAAADDEATLLVLAQAFGVPWWSPELSGDRLSRSPRRTTRPSS